VDGNSLLGGFITIGIFLLVQLVAAIWWASSISTKMSFVLDRMSNLDGFSTKAELAQALAAHDKEMTTALAFANKELATMWKKFDTLNDRIASIEKVCDKCE
jgi:hypothetical protein